MTLYVLTVTPLKHHWAFTTVFVGLIHMTLAVVLEYHLSVYVEFYEFLMIQIPYKIMEKNWYDWWNED